MAASRGDADRAPESGGWSPDRIEVDRVGVLRACAWPLSTLDGFEHRDLAERADALIDARDAVEAASEDMADELGAAVPRAERATRATLLDLRRRCHRDRSPFDEPTAPERSALRESGALSSWTALAEQRHALALAEESFGAAYELARAEDRGELGRLSASISFRRALVLANRGLAQRWADRDLDVDAWRARDHRAERAVFRYLVRAATRPVPQGLWAGVCAIEPGGDGPVGQVSLEPTASAVTVDPDLAPLAAAVFARVRSGRVLDRLLVLDATVHHSGAGWRFEHGSDEMVWSTMQSDDLIDAIVDHLWSGPARLRDLDLAALDVDADGSVVERLASGLLAAGFLVPAWSPAITGDSWSVLEGAAEVMLDDERSVWSDALASLRSICHRLETLLSSIEPDALAELLDEAAGLVAGLWVWAGIQVDAPTHVLFVDLGLAYRAHWNDATERAAHTAVVEQLALGGGLGSGEWSRKVALRDFSRGPVPEVLAGITSSSSMGSGQDGVGRVSAGWAQLLEQRTASIGDALTLPPDALDASGAAPGPEGSVLLVPEGDGFLLSFARPQGDVFLSRSERLTGVRPIGLPRDLATSTLELDSAPNPSASRGQLVEGADAISSGRGMPPLATRTVSWTEEDRPLLVHEGHRSWLRYPASAAPRSARELALTRLAFGHGWEHLSHGVPLVDDEVDDPRGTPSVALPGGGLVSRRRWVLGPDVVAAVAAASGAERFLLLRRLLRPRGLGGESCIRVRFGARADAPSLVVPHSSPLALDAALDRMGRGGMVVLERWSPPPVRDATGTTYAAEVAIRWSDPDYWARRASQLAATERRDAGGVRAAGPTWHQLDLTVPDPGNSTPALPLRALGDLVDELGCRDDISGVWFVRKPPGIRLRIASDDSLPPDVGQWADRLVESGQLSSWAPGVYRPEVRRFGGPIGLALAHRLFTADTHVALALDRLPPADADHLRFPLGLSLVDLLSGVLDDASGLARCWTLLAAMTPLVVVSDDDRAHASVDTRALRSSTTVDRLQMLAAPVASVVDELATDLAVAAEEGRLEVGRASWLAAATVFGWNRLGLPLQLGRLQAHLEGRGAPPGPH